MTHRKLSPETYQKAFSLYEEGYSMKNVIQKLNLNCSPRTLLINYYKFKKHGIKVLLPIQRNNTYSNEFKLKVVHEYIN
ncbi:hypothetical protein EN872_16920, partial [bacterium M00.F.Ca.ET.229.01.1.1]